MIEGAVNASLEAVLAVSVTGPEGRAQTVEAVIDTGYNGLLTLPPAAVQQLALPFVTRGQATLANGSKDVFDVYDATSSWDGKAIDILIDEADTTPLVGMALLENHSLHIDVRIGGRATIEANERDQRPTA